MSLLNIQHTRFRFGLLLILPVMVILLAACGGSPTSLPATSAPGSTSTDETGGGEIVGDAARGAQLFTQMVNGSPSCSTCHATDGRVIVGPGFEGFGDAAGTRVEGQTAEEYTHASIVRPSEHVVSGYSNSMYNQYERALSEQDIADLVAYLLTL